MQICAEIGGKILLFIFLFSKYKEVQPASGNFTKDFISNVSKPYAWEQLRIIHNVSSS